MSYSINGKNITLTRGDTAFVHLNLTYEGEPYVPQEGDAIRFAVKQKFKDPDSDVLINKQIPTDTLILEIEPADTKEMTMGKDYVYDIEYTDAAGHVFTFLKGTLHIDEEVL